MSWRLYDAADAWSGALALARGGLVGVAGGAGPAPGALAAFADTGPGGAERPTVRADAPAWALGPALGELVRAAAESQPVVLAVDDAQWLDRESLLALIAALRDLTPLPVALILALDPLPWRAEVDQLRVLLGPELGGASVMLPALGQGPLHALARRLVPGSTGSARDGLVRRVAEVSGGASGLGGRALPRRPARAGSRRHRHRRRRTGGDSNGYRRLSPEARRVLGAASVLAGRASSAQLARALDAGPESVRGPLEELTCERWLVAEPRGYGFVAADARQIIQREMVTLGQRNRWLQNDAAPWPA